MDYSGIEYKLVKVLKDYLDSLNEQEDDAITALYASDQAYIDAARAAAYVLINYDRGRRGEIISP